MTDKRGPLQREVEETSLKELGIELSNIDPRPSGEDESEGLTGEEGTEKTLIRALQTETLEVPMHTCIDLQDAYIIQTLPGPHPW